MSKLSKIAITLLLLAGFGAALFFSLRGQRAEVAKQQDNAAVAAAGAINGGVSSILRMVADNIEREIGQSIGDLFPIDYALKTGEPLRLYGQDISLDKHQAQIEATCKTFVSDMVARLGAAGDINRIALCGDGVRLFTAALKSAFRAWAIHVCKEPIFANVRGFQFAGDDYAADLTTEAA